MRKGEYLGLSALVGVIRLTENIFEGAYTLPYGFLFR